MRMKQLEQARLVGVGGVLCHSKGEGMLMLSKHVEVRDSNEVLAILEAFRIYSSLFKDRLIMESDSSNAIS